MKWDPAYPVEGYEGSMYLTKFDANNTFVDTLKPEDRPLFFPLYFSANSKSLLGEYNAREFYVKELEDYGLDNRLYYSKVTWYYSSSLGDKFLELVKEVGYSLVGVDKDGVETVISLNPPIHESIEINDKEDKYERLILRFHKPLHLKKENEVVNTTFYLNVYTNVKDEVWASWTPADLGTGGPRSEDMINKAKLTYSQSENPEVFNTLEDDAIGFYKSPEASIYASQSDDPSLERVYDGNSIALPPNFLYKYTDPNNEVATENIKHISLIPDGYEFDVENMNLEYPYEIIPNYKGTGQTALIIDWKSQASGEYLHRRVDILLKPNINLVEELSEITHYIVWDDKTNLTPVSPWNSTFEVVDDVLDLDNNGLTTDKALKYKNTIRLLLPEELVISKYVSSDKTIWTGKQEYIDFPNEFYYKIRLNNKLPFNMNSIQVLEVLPNVRDTSIVPNKEGEYPARQTRIPVQLTCALEDIPENQGLVNKWDFYYSTEGQGQNIEQTKEDGFVTKDQIQDFSKVKKVKIVLKEGQALGGQEIVEFLLYAKADQSAKLKHLDWSVNSEAVSRNDGNTFIEGNKVISAYPIYTVEGVSFLDSNQNGSKDAGENVVLGTVVKLMKEDGTVATDLEGKEITATVGADGRYSLKTFVRGNYYIEVVKPKVDNEFAALGQANDPKMDNHTSAVDERSGKTEIFKLYPTQNYKAIKNIGYIQAEEEKVFIAKKVWVDAPEKVPNITLVLQQNGADFNRADARVTLESGQLEVTWTNLPVKDENGVAFEYSVKEEPVVGYVTTYETNVEETVVTNTKEPPIPWLPLTPAKIKVKVTKEWGSEIKEESVRIRLVKNGLDTDEIIELNEENNWTGYFENLPVQEAWSSSKNEYSVTEVNEYYGFARMRDRRYKVEYSGSVSEGFVVKNTEVPADKISIDVTKHWIGIAEGLPITVELYKNDEPTGLTLELNKENNWTARFEDLPASDSFYSQNHFYTIKEVGEEEGKINIEGKEFLVTYDGDYYYGFDIYNQFESPSKDIPVQKVWNGNVSEESVSVALLKNGQRTGLVKVLNKDNQWSATFENQKLQDPDRTTPNEYAVEEIGENDGFYSDFFNRYAVTYSGDVDNGFVITNTEVLPSPINIDVVKVWEGSEPAGDVRVELYKDYEPTGLMLTLNEDNQWRGTFEGVAYSEHWHSIPHTYHVKEVGTENGYIELNGKRFLVSENRVNDNLFEIRNTYAPEPIPERELKISKVWEGNQEEEYVPITILRDGQPYHFAALYASEGWTDTFTGLPVYDPETLVPYEYSVEETGAKSGIYTTEDKSYQVEITGDMEEGYTIKNTFIPQKPLEPAKIKVDVTKVWVGDVKESEVHIVLIKNGIETNQVLTLNEENQWQGSFEDLPVMDEETSVAENVYTVNEVGARDNELVVGEHKYIVSLEGDANNGFKITNTFEAPKVPEQPEEPDKPSVPDQPEEPDKPSVPDQPEEPGKPSVPDQPEKPEKPSMPDQPEKPEKPSIPEKPKKLELPKSPSKGVSSNLKAPKTGDFILGEIAILGIALVLFGMVFEKKRSK